MSIVYYLDNYELLLIIKFAPAHCTTALSTFLGSEASGMDYHTVGTFIPRYISTFAFLFYYRVIIFLWHSYDPIVCTTNTIPSLITLTSCLVPLCCFTQKMLC